MKPETLGYWSATGLLAAALLAGGGAQLAAVPQTVAGIRLFFDLTGAVASHVLSGDAAGGTAPLILLALAAVSWRLRPADRAWPYGASGAAAGAAHAE